MIDPFGLEEVGCQSESPAACSRIERRPTFGEASTIAGFVLSSRAEMSRWIDEFEAAHTVTLFIADPSASSWTRQCVEHADEIVLVANADSQSLFSPIERELFGDREAGVHPRQTLLLLHDRDFPQPDRDCCMARGARCRGHIHLRIGDEKHMKRLVRLLSGRGIGIVLSGGGARGSAHVGVFRALSEAGIEADVIGVASIGSVMGAWQSMGVRDDTLIEAARRAFVDSGHPVGDYNAFPFVSLVSGRKVRRLTEQAIRDIAGADVDIEDTWITFFCIAANFSTSEESILSRCQAATRDAGPRRLVHCTNARWDRLPRLEEVFGRYRHRR